MEMTAIADFGAKAAADSRFGELSAICGRHRGLWNAEAERYLLENW
jgi:hypothetical protein